MKVKLFNRFLFIFFAVLALSSCKTAKQLSYFQDLNDTSKVQLAKLYPYQPLKLQIDDQLQILITSTSADASSFFNLSLSTTNTTSALQLNEYQVNAAGNIILPVIGEMKVIGLTTMELREKIRQAVTPYVKDVVVIVRLLNFKVTVIGEVNRSIIIPVNGERINVLEAIGAAGDMTIYSKRYNVKVLRKSLDSMSVAHLNFNYSSIMNSPYFQLQQNDVVYIEPEKSRGFSAERGVILLPVITSLATLAITLFALLRR